MNNFRKNLTIVAVIALNAILLLTPARGYANTINTVESQINEPKLVETIKDELKELPKAEPKAVNKEEKTVTTKTPTPPKEEVIEPKAEEKKQTLEVPKTGESKVVTPLITDPELENSK